MFLFVSSFSHGKGASSNQIDRWQGSLLSKTDSAFYLHFAYTPDKDKKLSPLYGEAKLTLRNLLTKKQFSFKQLPKDNDSAPETLWRIPSGKYALWEVVITDSNGKQRSWKASKKNRRRLLAKRRSLANFGTWEISPQGPGAIDIDFKMRENIFLDEGSLKESSIKTVIDGFTGKAQFKLKANVKIKMPKPAKINKELAFYFTINLYKNIGFAPEVASIMSAYDKEFRNCYLEALGRDQAVQGEITFKFLISKKSKGIKKVKVTKATIEDAELAECVAIRLKQLEIPAQKNILGSITMFFEILD